MKNSERKMEKTPNNEKYLKHIRNMLVAILIWLIVKGIYGFLQDATTATMY